jgi:hypothetical protein
MSRRLKGQVAVQASWRVCRRRVRQFRLAEHWRSVTGQELVDEALKVRVQGSLQPGVRFTEGSPAGQEVGRGMPQTA